MKLKPIEYLIENLKDESFIKTSIYNMPKEQAYSELKRISGLDFGYDPERWEEWERKTRAKRILFLIPKKFIAIIRTMFNKQKS
jgi:hypothetical protein